MKKFRDRRTNISTGKTNTVIQIDNERFLKMSDNELKRYIREKGKTANQRLRQLEKDNLTGSSGAYKFIKALEQYGDSAITHTAKRQVKFNVAVSKKGRKELYYIATRIEKFLTAQTSTKTGIFEKYKKTYETFTKDSNNNLSFTEWSYFFESGVAQAIKEMYGSDTMQEVLNSEGVTAEKIETILKKGGYLSEKNELQGNWEDLTIDEFWEDLEKA